MSEVKFTEKELQSLQELSTKSNGITNNKLNPASTKVHFAISPTLTPPNWAARTSGGV